MTDSFERSRFESRQRNLCRQNRRSGDETQGLTPVRPEMLICQMLEITALSIGGGAPTTRRTTATALAAEVASRASARAVEVAAATAGHTAATGAVAATVGLVLAGLDLDVLSVDGVRVGSNSSLETLGGLVLDKGAVLLSS